MPALWTVHNGVAMGWGGQEIRILTEARGFIDRGHRVMVYAAAGSRIADEAAGYGVPCSAMRPRSSTTMRSACSIVDSRCAITIVVRPCISASSAAWT